MQSIVVLLRPEADAPGLTGVFSYKPPHGGSLEFEFDVVRLWQRPVDTLLAGGLGTLPLAPLGDVAPAALPSVIRRLDERLRQEVPPAEGALLWTSTYILMGLRYNADFVAHLIQGVRAMKESSTYQAILAEGRTEEAKRLLLLMGDKRFGPPTAQTRALLDTVNSIERLEQLTQRILDVSSWDELLASS